MSANRSFRPNFHDWSSETVLKQPPAPTDVTKSIIHHRKDYFFHDMCSEYDSIHLANYLRESDIQLSPDFWNLCTYWLKDESNHYRGLRQIYSYLYSQPIDQIAYEVESRKPDFAPIGGLISSEFHLLTSIAFDEITSARAYAKDRENYELIGGDSFLTWVKYAGRDEAVHARNALELIKCRYPDRLAEIPEHVERICQYDIKGDRVYYGTFLFDHDTDDFSKELLIESARTLCSYFDRGPEFDMMLRSIAF